MSKKITLAPVLSVVGRRAHGALEPRRGAQVGHRVVVALYERGDERADPLQELLLDITELGREWRAQQRHIADRVVWALQDGRRDHVI